MPSPPVPRSSCRSAPIDAARNELAHRLNVNVTSRDEVQRTRLERRFVQLRKLLAWGDVTDAEYRAEVAETREALAALPDPDKLVAFDRNRHAVAALTDAIESLPGEGRRDLLALLLEYAEASDRKLIPQRLVWTPPLRPFFETASAFAPPDGLEPPVPT